MFRRRSNTHQGREDGHQKSDSKVNELKAAMWTLTGRSLEYCGDACLRRYLEAWSWNVDKAKKMLEDSLKWRSAFKPEKICWEEVAGEGETGKVYRANFHDRQGRTALILRPAFQGQEQMSWLIDFTGWSLASSVPIKSASETVNILQNHYPERLAIAFPYNPPRIFEAFWKVVKYFLDAKTFQKVKFVYPKNKDSVELMRTLFDEENLPSEFGGRGMLSYDYEEFSKLMSGDDEKAANLRGGDQMTGKLQSKPHSGAEVAPEPEEVELPSS